MKTPAVLFAGVWLAVASLTTASRISTISAQIDAAAGAAGSGSVGAPQAVALLPVEPPRGASAADIQQVPRGEESDIDAFKAGILRTGVAAAAPDPTVTEDRSPIGPRPAAARMSPSFQGIGPTGSWPPDPILAAGPSHLLQAVNSSFRITDKAGTTLAERTFASWFSNVADTSGQKAPFDPKVAYDQFEGRWIMVVVNVDAALQRSFYLISVSTSSDPMAGWCNWALRSDVNGSALSGNWADYPQLGYDITNFYLSSNQFSLSNNAFAYAKLRVMGKEQFYSCQGVGWYDFWGGSGGGITDSPFTLQPAHTFGSPGVEYIVNASSSSSGTSLRTRTVSGTWPNSSNSAPSLSAATIVGVTSFQAPVNAPSLGSVTPIHTGDARLLNAVYRDGFLHTIHTVGIPCFGSTTSSCFRYYKIDVRGNIPRINVQESFGAADHFVFWPAVMPDPQGDVLVVYSQTAANQYVEARHTLRGAADEAFQPSGSLHAGEAPYQVLDGSGRNRWGDYAGIASDPAEDAVWIFHEYASLPANTWRTWVGRLTVPRPNIGIDDVSLREGDSGTKDATFTISLSEEISSTVVVNWDTTDGTARGARFANTAEIAFPSTQTSTVTSASLYPSSIVVPSGYGSITRLSVVLRGMNHPTPGDLDVLLVGPGGQKVTLLSDIACPGEQGPCNGPIPAAADLTLTIDMDAATSIPAAPVSGTFKPTNGEPSFSEFFPLPGPGSVVDSQFPDLSIFNGTDPTGEWKLYVVDDRGSLDSGFLGFARGWSLHMRTTLTDYVATSGSTTIPAGSVSRTLAVPVLGDSTRESVETFSIRLESATGGKIVDAEALARIIDDDFTDVSLAGLTIRTAHVTELRDVINELRAAKGLPAFSFTDGALTAAVTGIRAVHIAELRTALNAVYAAAGAAAPIYTDPSLTAGVTTIKAIHISEIRDGVLNAP